MKPDKYTYNDVIINPNDDRLKGLRKGAICYFGDSPYTLLYSANKNMKTNSIPPVCYGKLLRVDAIGDKPFHSQYLKYTCIIIDGFDESEYEPFDLNKKEDRDFLRDKWYKNKYTKAESKITDFGTRDDEYLADGETGEILFEHYTFLDGSPVGKLKSDVK